MLQGLPWLVEVLCSSDEPHISNPTSTSGFSSSGTWLTVTSSLSVTTRNKGWMLDIMICNKHNAWKMYTGAWMNSNKINKLEYNFPSRYSCTTRVHSIVFIFTKKHFNYLLTSWLIIYKKGINFQWNSRGFSCSKVHNSNKNTQKPFKHLSKSFWYLLNTLKAFKHTYINYAS